MVRPRPPVRVTGRYKFRWCWFPELLGSSDSSGVLNIPISGSCPKSCQIRKFIQYDLMRFCEPNRTELGDGVRLQTDMGLRPAFSSPWPQLIWAQVESRTRRSAISAGQQSEIRVRPPFSRRSSKNEYPAGNMSSDFQPPGFRRIGRSASKTLQDARRGTGVHTLHDCW